MSPTEARAIRYLAVNPRTASRAVARALWPDSPAWGMRTASRPSRPSGAIGGTMPMNAARVLHRLADRGLVVREYSATGQVLWSASLTGLDAAAKVPSPTRTDVP